MIQQALNTFIYLMLARFVLNDVSHMLDSYYSWVEDAWVEFNKYAISHGIRFFTPNEAYRSMIERRMPMNDLGVRPAPISDAVRAQLFQYEKTLVEGPLPNWRIPPVRAIENLRAYMAGYHLIAMGVAPNQVVNDVYYLMRGRFLPFYGAYKKAPARITEVELLSGTDQWYKDLRAAANLFIDGTRADKVIAIDAVAHLLHEYEPRTLVEDLFVTGLESFHGTPIWVALNQMFDIWFGVVPRRGISLVEYIEGA